MRTNEVYVTAFTSEQAEDTDVLLKRLAERYAEEIGIPCGNLDVVREEYQKPHFAGSDLFFSVSHSGNYVLFALGLANLGIDIQKYKQCSFERIAGRFFNSAEYEYLKRSSFKDFFDVWTAKESYVKYTGQGINNDYGKFSVINDRGEIGMDGLYLTRIPFVDGYSVCLCTDRKISVRIFCA